MDIKTIKFIGDQKQIEKLPELLEIMRTGNYTQKSLSASAIKKLSQEYKQQCGVAVPQLFALLEDDAPQVRQYSLNTIKELISVYTFNEQELSLLRNIREQDSSEYNKNIAQMILHKIEVQFAKKVVNQQSKNICLDKLFRNLEFRVQKGKGFSIYNVSDSQFKIMIEQFQTILQDRCKTIILSEIQNYKVDLQEKGLIIIYQNLDFQELFSEVDKIVNKLIYPAWYKGNSIIFISNIDKVHYIVDEIQTSLIHSDYNAVVNWLSLEQLNSLLDLVNVNISSPQLLSEFDAEVMYTPIEKIFYDKLIKNNISFEPQVRIGRFFVDFLITINNIKTIVECDGRDYHDRERDTNRDKELEKEGYRIVRFSGSRLYYDCDQCIEELMSYSKHLNTKLILDELNAEQISAVHHITGPMRVLAPAGSGKTKTLVNRIVNLINSGVNSSEILALAFNKKAEKEMSLRLSEKFGITNVNVKTFHSFGNEIIKRTMKWTFDAKKQSVITRKLLENAVKNHTTITYQRNKDSMDEYLSTLSRVKNNLLPLSEVLVENENKAISFEPIYNDYIQSAFSNNFYNYDDMLYISTRKLLSDPILRRKLQNKYKYILVDEFQDLNRVQILMLHMLALPENNLFIVGDDDQMIYGFRGAEVKHILEFDKRYTINSDQVLKINYRSYRNIVRHSRWLIDHNRMRVYKDIIPYTDVNGDISLYIGESLTDQAEYIARWINQNKNENTNWSDFAILYRYNQYNDVLYIVLSKANIPVRFNGIKAMNSNVANCLFSYLSIVLQKDMNNKQHYNRILKTPNKYFTNDFIDTIESLDDLLNIEKAKNQLRSMDEARYSSFVNKILKITQLTSGIKPGELINTIIVEFGLRDFYKDKSISNVEVDTATEYDLLDIIQSFAEKFEDVQELYQYWNNIGNIHDEEDDDESDKVILTSIHKTKGNEYKNVTYFNMTRKATDRATELEMEEERRVVYVGVTRSQKGLLITSQKSELSPFLREYFLNPEFSETGNQQLEEKKRIIQTRINVVNSNIKQLDEQISDYISKYPELEGRNIVINGWFKGIKRKLRNKNVQTALRKVEELHNQKNQMIGNISASKNELWDFEEEMKYREILDKAQQ
jgi:DNA helicase-2/ATP-dependent DNA helicase PcrA